MLVFKAVTKDAKQFHEGAPQITNATPMYKTEKSKPTVQYYHCSKINHKASDCWLKDLECSTCHKKRNLASVCQSGSSGT